MFLGGGEGGGGVATEWVVESISVVADLLSE